MKAGKILLGILSGAAAGVAAGMLFAPKKGSDTRQRIADRSNEYMNGTRTRFNNMAGSVSHTIDSVKSRTIGKAKRMQPEMNGDDKIIY